MITVEVLISLLILFMVIATSTATIKQLNIIRSQQINNEEFYMVVLNIKDYIDNTICIQNTSLQNSFEDFNFQAKCTLIQKKRKFTKQGLTEGNIGNSFILLYKIQLKIIKDNFSKVYTYYKTVAK